MATDRTNQSIAQLAFESFGVPVRVRWDGPEIGDRVPEILPPEFVEIPAESEAEEFGLAPDGGGTYTFTRDGSPVSSDIDLEFGLMMLQTQIQIYIGLRAPERIFVHAGAVAIGGNAVIFPGRSFSGKTSLVASFLRAGATYMSDEFAVFDNQGMVSPFPTVLSVRDGGDERREVDAVGLGSGGTATSSLPLGAIVVTTYLPGGHWAPATITRGNAVLALLDNSVAAIERHAEALTIFRHATAGPLLLEGERGEAEAVVADLMARLS